MTDEQINAAIAEACGWREVRVDGDSGIYKGFICSSELRPDLPDYVNDLNAMHEAEKFLTEKQRDDYWYWLTPNIFAASRERAETFLQVLQHKKHTT